MKLIIEKLLGSQDLNQSESKNVMLEIMSEKYDDVQIAGFLIALRSKGGVRRPPMPNQQNPYTHQETSSVPLSICLVTFWIAFQTRLGVRGMSTCLTPR